MLAQRLCHDGRNDFSGEVPVKSMTRAFCHNGSKRSASPSGRWLSAVLAGMLLFSVPFLNSPSAMALPTGYAVESGDVQFDQPDANTLNITSRSLQSIVRYQQFDIAAHERVNFFLSLPQGSLLNYVIGGQTSRILGAMNANGHVFLVNPAGIEIGPMARLNVGSLVLSTLSMKPQDFMARDYTFRRDPAQLAAALRNEGHIEAAPGGYVVLNGPAVANTGNIHAPGGSVQIAVGDEIAMRTPDGVAVQVRVDKALSGKVEGYQDAIRNAGTIAANDGLVRLQADLSRQLYARAINNTGVIQAQSITRNGQGQIALQAASEDRSALVVNTGVIDASAATEQATAGDVSIQGDAITSSGQVLATAAEDGAGGSIDIASRQQTRLESGGVTSVAAVGESGSAGSVRIWSDVDTLFQRDALIDVRGGRRHGDGGFAEVSAQNTVIYEGLARGEAPGGTAGSLLIDPVNIVIQNGGSNPGGGTVAYTVNPGADSAFDPSFLADLPRLTCRRPMILRLSMPLICLRRPVLRCRPIMTSISTTP